MKNKKHWFKRLDKFLDKQLEHQQNMQLIQNQPQQQQQINLSTNNKAVETKLIEE